MDVFERFGETLKQKSKIAADKAKERLCTAAQIEVMRNTKFTIERIIKNTDNEYVRKDLEAINTGARCTSGFKCATPCAFKEGIDLTRLI